MKTFLVLVYSFISISVIYAQNPEWINYTTSNTGLPSNYVYSIAIDGSGNKWIGTNGGGLAVYKEGGVVSVKEISNKNIPE